MIVIYESHDEILVCSVENEAELIKHWFLQADSGRDIDEYTRSETEVGKFQLNSIRVSCETLK